MHIQISNQEKPELGFGGYTCNWQTHIYKPDETEKESDKITFGFLHQGDIKNDTQPYCPFERTNEGFIVDYGVQYFDCKIKHTVLTYFGSWVKSVGYPVRVLNPDRGLVIKSTGLNHNPIFYIALKSSIIIVPFTNNYG